MNWTKPSNRPSWNIIICAILMLIAFDGLIKQTTSIKISKLHLPLVSGSEIVFNRIKTKYYPFFCLKYRNKIYLHWTHKRNISSANEEKRYRFLVAKKEFFTYVVYWLMCKWDPKNYRTTTLVQYLKLRLLLPLLLTRVI